MKKAKIILTAIAVLAIVGGALAFKANRGPNPARVYVSTKLTSSIIGGFTYTTVVNSCVPDQLVFLGPGNLDNTYITLQATLTGFSAGNARTWRELVCTTSDVFTTDIP